MMPILIVAGILVMHFVWQIAPIPSAQYPYANMMWPINATWECINKTALRDGNSQMLQAIRGDYLSAGLTSSLGIYGLLWVAKLPTMWFYGLVGGIGAASEFRSTHLFPQSELRSCYRLFLILLDLLYQYYLNNELLLYCHIQTVLLL